MIRSMTGFGRYEASDDAHRILVEIRAVNHRYLDFAIKLPKNFYRFESRIRRLMKEYAARGKIDVSITCEESGTSGAALHYNESLAGEYMKYFAAMREKFDLKDDITVSRLAECPDVLLLEPEEEEGEALWPLLEEALQGAGVEFARQKEREGEQLGADLLGKLDIMEADVARIEERSPAVVEEYRARLEARMREVLASSKTDETRLMTEVAVFADRTCVDEETVRLRSHIESMRRTLSGDQPEGVGRKLDFLTQEMNREANTILSKCSGLDISATAIALKTEIEKIREQVQNIE